MIAGGPPTKPGLGVGHVRIRARSWRHIKSALRHRVPGCQECWIGWQSQNASASASPWVLTRHGRGRIAIQRGIGVVGLAADVADRKYQVFGKLALHGKVPYLDSRGEHVRIETGGLINRAGLRDPWAARGR